MPELTDTVPADSASAPAASAPTSWFSTATTVAAAAATWLPWSTNTAPAATDEPPSPQGTELEEDDEEPVLVSPEDASDDLELATMLASLLMRDASPHADSEKQSIAGNDADSTPPAASELSTLKLLAKAPNLQTWQTFLESAAVHTALAKAPQLAHALSNATLVELLATSLKAANAQREKDAQTMVELIAKLAQQTKVNTELTQKLDGAESMLKTAHADHAAALARVDQVAADKAALVKELAQVREQLATTKVQSYASAAARAPGGVNARPQPRPFLASGGPRPSLVQLTSAHPPGIRGVTAGGATPRPKSGA